MHISFVIFNQKFFSWCTVIKNTSPISLQYAEVSKFRLENNDIIFSASWYDTVAQSKFLVLIICHG